MKILILLAGIFSIVFMGACSSAQKSNVDNAAKSRTVANSPDRVLLPASTYCSARKAGATCIQDDSYLVGTCVSYPATPGASGADTCAIPRFDKASPPVTECTTKTNGSTCLREYGYLGVCVSTKTANLCIIPMYDHDE